VALSVVLVIGAGLMLRSFQRLTATDPGFRPDNVLLVRFALRFEDSEGAGPLIAARRRIVERVRAVPGVLAAGATKAAPLSSRDLNGEPLPFTVPGRPAPAPGEEPRVLIQPVSPGYLRTLGIPLLAGEDIQSAAGDSNPAPVAVISRRMADRMWPGQSAVGQSFLLGKTPVRVAGVAGDVRNVRLDSVAGFTAYLPDEMMPRSAVSLVVRTAGDPARLADAVRAAVREAMPGQAFQEVVPLRAKVSDAASTARLFTTLVTVFGLVALTLAAVGLYGVVSYVVRQREREIGVRLALGAPPRRVLALVVRQGMTPVVAGLGIGLVAAVGVTRVLRVLLFEVSATDPLTFVAVSVLLGLVALAAAFLPSRRASRVHPAVTLRAD
jgi:predicted permease